MSGAAALDGAAMASPDPSPEPFGTFALPGPLEWLRQRGNRLGRGGVARRLVSLIRRCCLLGREDPFDVEPFAGQRARLYPRDNLSEKRVFTGAQFWDFGEREVLARAVAAHDGACDGSFVFVDAGANAGLYTLFVRAQTGDLGKGLKALAVEPDPENARRLRCNLALSGAGADVTVAELALAAEAGEVSLTDGGANRGEIMLGEGGARVRAATLAELLAEQGFDRVDAMKIDIEGVEETVLSAFYDTAARALWPRMLLMEARHGAETAALALCRAKGYEETARTRLNVILTLPSDGTGGTGEEHVEA